MPIPLTRTADGLIVSGVSRALGEYPALTTAHAAERLQRIRRGVYVDTAHAEALRESERYRLRSLAAATQRRAPVLAACSAAVVRGLPLIGSLPKEVYMLAPATSVRRRNGITEIVRPHACIEVRDGLAMTSIVDTLIDVARTSPLLTALAMFDAALHPGDDGAMCTREELEEAFVARLPFRGSRQVRAVLDRCTDLAESPLETLSRWQIEVSGFPAPELQVPVHVPTLGKTVRLDMVWREFGIWGEADGREKYLSDDGDPGQRVYEEKLREDAVRHITGWRCVRWGWMDAWAGDPLRMLLMQAGLPRSVARSSRTFAH